MNERAVPSATPLPLWYLGEDASVFAGILGVHAPHAHSVPVLLAGLYEPVRLSVDGAPLLTTRAAVIPAGRSYALDGRGAPVAVLYLEPATAGIEALAPLLRARRAVDGVLIGDASEGLLRDLFEDREAAAWAPAALADLLAFGAKRSERTLDGRIARALCELASSGEAGPAGLSASARAVGLSPSRFQHLFTRDVGVPFRRYRLWQRLKIAIRGITGGETFVSAAHDAGFSDQAHFSREFRRAFGAPPSLTLRDIRA